MEFKYDILFASYEHIGISFVWQPNDQVIACHTSSISQVVSNAISTLSIPDPFIILYWFVTSHNFGSLLC